MLIKNCSYLKPNGEIAEKVHWLIQDGRLHELSEAEAKAEEKRLRALPQAQLSRKSDSDAELFHPCILDASGLFALPAFADAHCHVPMVLLRGYGEGLPLQRWLEERVFPYEATLSDEDVYWGSLLGISELLASGCASFSDMYMNLPGICRAVLESGIKANLSHGCSCPGQDLPFEQTNAFKGTEAIFRAIRNSEQETAEPAPAGQSGVTFDPISAGSQEGRLRADLALHAEYTSGETTARTIVEAAKAHKLRLQIHLSETEKEHEEAKVRRGGRSPLAYLAACGALEVPVIFAHAVWLEESDFALLRQAVKQGADITLVHNPSSNLKLGSGIADLKRWQEAGVNIAIGTDGASSNNNLDMLEEIMLASLLQKGQSRDPMFMDPAMSFQLASEGGYLAQGRKDCGRIEEGARADLVFFKLDSPWLLPLYDVLANLLYSGNRNNIELTMVDGDILYRRGRFAHIDMSRVQREILRIQKEKASLLKS